MAKLEASCSCKKQISRFRIDRRNCLSCLRMWMDFAAHTVGKSTQIKPESRDVSASTLWTGKQLFINASTLVWFHVVTSN